MIEPDSVQPEDLPIPKVVHRFRQRPEGIKLFNTMSQIRKYAEKMGFTIVQEMSRYWIIVDSERRQVGDFTNYRGYGGWVAVDHQTWFKEYVEEIEWMISECDPYVGYLKARPLDPSESDEDRWAMYERAVKSELEDIADLQETLRLRKASH